jgi:hypothetical protein
MCFEAAIHYSTSPIFSLSPPMITTNILLPLITNLFAKIIILVNIGVMQGLYNNNNIRDFFQAKWETN